MSSIRAEIWCAAFIRTHNDLGHICVVSKRGDPIAGQIWIEVDHLDGNCSLFCQAPTAIQEQNPTALVFQCRLNRMPTEKVTLRLRQELNFDPDFWQLTLESSSGDHGLQIVKDVV